MTAAVIGLFAGGRELVRGDGIFRMRLAWRLWRDKRVSGLKYGLPILFALYFFSPVDVVPDWFLGVGHGDDMGVAIAILALLIRTLPRLAPASVVEEHVLDMSRGRWAPPTGMPGGSRVVDAGFTVRL